MRLPPEEVMKMPINLRKWMFERFLQQKEEEKAGERVITGHGFPTVYLGEGSARTRYKNGPIE